MTHYGLESINAVLRLGKHNNALTPLQIKMMGVKALFFNGDLTANKRIVNIISSFPTLPKNSIYKFIRYYPVGQMDVRTIPILGNVDRDTLNAKKDGAIAVELKGLPSFFSKPTNVSSQKPTFEPFTDLPIYALFDIMDVEKHYPTIDLTEYEPRKVAQLNADYGKKLAATVGLDMNSFAQLGLLTYPRTPLESAQRAFYVITVNTIDDQSTEELKELWASIKAVNNLA